MSTIDKIDNAEYYNKSISNHKIKSNHNYQNMTFESLFQGKKISTLLKLVQKALSSEEKTIKKSSLRFEFSDEASNFNAMILSENDFSIERLLQNEPDTVLHPGSEFRPIHSISQLFSLHRSHHKLIDIVTKGISYKFKEVFEYKEEDRILDLNNAISTEFNNKSATTNIPFVEKNINKEIIRGWSFPLPREFAKTLLDKIGFVPLGIAPQETIDGKGNIIPKYRLTQDCSRPNKSGFSINDNIDPESIECFFGHCLNRILLNILQIRLDYPTHSIGIAKHDMDSAYRRLHVQFEVSLLQSWVYKNFMIVNTRLPFGSSPAAPEFSIISDFICDLAQWLCDDISWDPKDLKASFAEDIPDPIISNRQNTEARPLVPKISPKPIYIDGFIDDAITIALMVENIMEKASNAVPLAMDCIFRPLDNKDTFERVKILQKEKLMAEGGLNEIQIVLGWKIDTRSLRAYLTESKAIRFSAHIKRILKDCSEKKIISAKTIEKLIGQLVHISYIAKEGPYFLNRFRYRLKKLMKNNKPYKATLSTTEKEDLILWLKIIEQTRTQGRSLNRMMETVPEFITISDASLHGMGGWMSFGPAWRFELPPHLQGIFSLNILEAIAAYWTLKLLLDIIGPSRVLMLLDSMVAKYWIVRNTFSPEESPVHDLICRWMGELLCLNDSAAVAFHVTGKSNLISDSLSRDSHIHHSVYLQVLKSALGTKFPNQLFLMEQNSKELLEKLEILKSKIPSQTPSPVEPNRSDLLASNYGKFTLLEKERTSFSKISLAKKRSKCLKPFASNIEIEDWAKCRGLQFTAVPSETQSLRFHRPSSRKDSETQQFHHPGN